MDFHGQVASVTGASGGIGGAPPGDGLSRAPRSRQMPAQMSVRPASTWLRLTILVAG